MEWPFIEEVTLFGVVVHTYLPSTWEEETRWWRSPSSNPDWFKQLLPGHQELYCETLSNKIKWPISLFRLRNSEVLQGKRELYLSCISQPGCKDRVHTLKNCILWPVFLFPISSPCWLKVLIHNSNMVLNQMFFISQENHIWGWCLIRYGKGTQGCKT